MSATANKPVGITTDFVAYYYTMRLKGFLRLYNKKKILVKEFSL
jgi:hypothetical protein